MYSLLNHYRQEVTMFILAISKYMYPLQNKISGLGVGGVGGYIEIALSVCPSHYLEVLFCIKTVAKLTIRVRVIVGLFSSQYAENSSQYAENSSQYAENSSQYADDSSNMQKIAHNMQKIAHNMQKIAHNMHKNSSQYAENSSQYLNIIW